MAFSWDILMERVHCHRCALDFGIPTKLVNGRGSMTTIWCPGCGMDYRRSQGISEPDRLRNLLEEEYKENRRLGRVIAGLRGAINARKGKRR